MSALATALVLGSAFMHATWNLSAKRSRDTLAFLWLINLATLVIYSIPFAIMLRTHPIPAAGWPFIIATGLFHICYFTCLANAYTHGALSVAYPISRGTGVLLVSLLAMPILGERISPGGGLGIALILVGLLLLHLKSLRALAGQPLGIVAGRQLSADNLGTLFALLTGVAICGYSLVDKAGVEHVHPVVYGYLIFVSLSLGLAPYVLSRRRTAAAREWSDNRLAILVGGVLVLGTYLIVLGAYRLAQVSYVVPLREVSVLIGTVLGVRLLHEGFGRSRIAGAAFILAGVLLISLLG